MEILLVLVGSSVFVMMLLEPVLQMHLGASEFKRELSILNDELR